MKVDCSVPLTLNYFKYILSCGFSYCLGMKGNRSREISLEKLGIIYLNTMKIIN